MINATYKQRLGRAVAKDPHTVLLLNLLLHQNHQSLTLIIV